MSFIVKPGRNPIVAKAFADLRADERRLARIHKAYRTKPAEPQEPAPSKKPKPSRSKGGKPSKVKS